MDKQKIIIGAATAAHQVEGNNTNSDIWTLEQMKYGGYPEKSGIAADHYHRYKEDIQLMKKAGLSAYRFSLEWARIEPSEGCWDEGEMKHYLDVIHFCKENKIEPILTLHHFSSPKWLIMKGGWESEYVIKAFEDYTRYVCSFLKNENIRYICTLNEANMGNLISIFVKQAMMQKSKNQKEALQVGLNINEIAKSELEKRKENQTVFGVDDPAVFVSPRSKKGNQIIMEAHKSAVKTIHSMLPEVKVGLTLSLRDVQAAEGGEKAAQKEWYEEFEQFLPAIQSDDFLGVQNYTRAVFGADGELPPEQGMELTQMGYEFYPQGLGNVIKKVSQQYFGEILVTENGIATDDDKRRIEYIRQALLSIKKCIDSGIRIKGYLYWSLLDNFEWQSGYAMRFGLVGVDRKTLQRMPRESLFYLGKTDIF